MQNPIVSGVYLLFDKHELAYVGRSRDVHSRIASHRTNGRPFDYALIAACSEAESGWVEAALLKAFEPRQNRLIPGAVGDMAGAVTLPDTPVSFAVARKICATYRVPLSRLKADLATGLLKSWLRNPTARRSSRLLLQTDLVNWCLARQSEMCNAADEDDLIG